MTLGVPWAVLIVVVAVVRGYPWWAVVVCAIVGGFAAGFAGAAIEDAVRYVRRRP